MMIRQITQINWRYIGDVLPSFIVMTFIPFSYSVAYGLIAQVTLSSLFDAHSDRDSGVFVYTVLNGLIGLVVLLSRGYIEPREYDLKEYWTWKGSGRPPWFVRALRRRRGASVENEHEDAIVGSAWTDSRGSGTKGDDQVASAAIAHNERDLPGPRWEP